MPRRAESLPEVLTQPKVRLRLNSAFSFYDDDLDIEEHEDVRDSPRQQGLEMEAVLEPSDEPETT